VARIEHYWQIDHLFVRLLAPIAALFCMVATLRRRAYLRGWLQVQRLGVPVIIVGNITVGGSGKTPFLIWLAGYLRAAGLRVGVISRGYGGRSRIWPQLVSENSDPVQVGDEPVLISRRTGCPLAVGPDRVAAGNHLLAHHAVDVILSDDGMQHYRLGRDMEIAVMDQSRGLWNGRCLPAGPLRERPARLDGVDLVVTHGPNGVMQLEGSDFIHLKDGHTSNAADFVPKKVHAIAGIGDPARFFCALRALEFDTIEHAFPDHYAFRASDITFGDGMPVVMTEKDAVKCREFAGDEHWYLPVQAKVAPQVGQEILRKLKR
jgi:tetraacyldisaccharide 4'-kinase